MKTSIPNDMTQKYSKSAIIIHWVTAALILILFPLGKYMEGLPAAEKLDLIKIHAGLGILVFVLTVIRTWVFFTKERPEDLRTGSKINDKLAVWVHYAFYFMLFAITLSGVASMALGGYGDAITSGDASLIKASAEVPPLKAHGLLNVLLMLLLALHVIGVAKHYLMTKENTLKRIS